MRQARPTNWKSVMTADMEIGFNARYLLDIAGQVDGDLVEFALADQGAPSLVRALVTGNLFV